MVEEQIAQRGIRDERVLEAMRRVPRHLFVPGELKMLAYEDCALPIGKGQTISQPYIIALMTSLLCLKGDETVLEIGSGSGYQAAVLAGLVRKVYTIERINSLADAARDLLRSLSINNVEVLCADGSLGYAAAAPYDGVLITAAAPEVPPALFEQLIGDGRLVLPVGGRGTQYLQLWTREYGAWQPENILPVAFVPLRGEAGWDADHWPEG